MKKTYRTEWTIETADSSYPIAGIQWYRGTIDMDNVHYCATELEAEREIDDAIISEQEMQIAKLSVSLREMLTEFKKPEWEIWCDHSVGICACGPISVLERAENAIKWAAALEANPSIITGKLKIAVQCIEANMEEFKYRTTEPNISGERHAVFTHHIQLCSSALKLIKE